MQTHRTVHIKFTDEDRAEYDALETKACAFYQSMKDKNVGAQLSRHFLKLTHMLKPIRIACAGGRIPLDGEPKSAKGEDDGENLDNDEDDDQDSENEDDTDDDESDDDGGGHKRKKKTQLFSKHAFESKLKTLVAELEAIRNTDPKGTFLEAMTFYRYWAI